MHFHSALIVASLIGTVCTMVTLRNPRQYPGDEIPEQWLPHQKLDHLDPKNPSTWTQRYFMDDEYFTNDSGPIFLFISDQVALDSYVFSDTYISIYASQYNALCFALEHRFYGNSRPKPDLRLENLQYLSSEQALADIAYFINNMNTKYNLTSNNKWVVFGGGYAGALAAWARMKYPHLIHAAVSSSGTVLAKGSIEIGDFAAQIFPLSSELCADNVHHAAVKVADLFNQTGGIEIITKKFNICPPSIDVNSSADVHLFTKYIVDAIFYTFVNEGIRGVQSFCEIMTHGQGDLLERLANATFFPPGECNRFDKFTLVALFFEATNYIDILSIGLRQTLYQQCTEFGFFTTASSRQGYLGFDLNLQLYIDLCKYVFGEQFNLELLNEGIKRINTMYGGLDIEVTRVVFVQGSIDPLSTLGVRTSKPDAPAIVINGAFHCQDLYLPRDDDPQALTDARKEINDLIGRWLSVMTPA